MRTTYFDSTSLLSWRILPCYVSVATDNERVPLSVCTVISFSVFEVVSPASVMVLQGFGARG